jgi:hypothetical protein
VCNFRFTPAGLTSAALPHSIYEYLSRYTHRVAISNQRLVAFDERGVTFRWKDYRVKGRTRYKTMTLETGEFMRRFLLHVLPSGFHRIRHYGLLANPVRRARLAKVRDLLHVAPEVSPPPDDTVLQTRPTGGRLRVSLRQALRSPPSSSRMRNCTASLRRQRPSGTPPDPASSNTTDHPGPSIAIAAKPPTALGHSAVSSIE